MREAERGVKFAMTENRDSKSEDREAKTAWLKAAAISSRFPMTKSLLAQLTGGDRRSLGHANEVAAMVVKNPEMFPALFEGLWSADPLVRMRAADAAEKVTRTKHELLQPYKKELLGLMAEERQAEVRWHLALMIPRLRLNAKEREAAVSLLHAYLEDHSSIVRTHALQGLADLAQDNAAMRPEVMELLRKATRSGTAAMKARGRKLLTRFERA